MGAWGTSLYANDSACDVRGEYVDKLRFGKSNEEATEELINSNQDIMGDMEEEPLFWYALADTQWNYGRLLPKVKEKALYFLSQKEELERWKDSGKKQYNAWINTLSKLKEKLLSPQPCEKKVSRYRIYRCKWNLGDVFAYRFSSEYSKEKGFFGYYVLFRKVSEDTWHPGHIIPVVQVYMWIGKEIPLLSELSGMELLPTFYKPLALANLPDKRLEFEIELISESEKAIPKDNLTFLGNIQGEDLIPFRGYDYWTGYFSVGWESSKYNVKFERYIIDMYLAWKDVKLPG